MSQLGLVFMSLGILVSSIGLVIDLWIPKTLVWTVFLTAVVGSLLFVYGLYRLVVDSKEVKK